MRFRRNETETVEVAVEVIRDPRQAPVVLEANAIVRGEEQRLREANAALLAAKSSGRPRLMLEADDVVLEVSDRLTAAQHVASRALEVATAEARAACLSVYREKLRAQYAVMLQTFEANEDTRRFWEAASAVGVKLPELYVPWLMPPRGNAASWFDQWQRNVQRETDAIAISELSWPDRVPPGYSVECQDTSCKVCRIPLQRASESRP